MRKSNKFRNLRERERERETSFRKRTVTLMMCLEKVSQKYALLKWLELSSHNATTWSREIMLLIGYEKSAHDFAKGYCNTKQIMMPPISYSCPFLVALFRRVASQKANRKLIPPRSRSPRCRRFDLVLSTIASHPAKNLFMNQPWSKSNGTFRNHRCSLILAEMSSSALPSMERDNYRKVYRRPQSGISSNVVGTCDY